MRGFWIRGSGLELGPGFTVTPEPHGGYLRVAAAADVTREVLAGLAKTHATDVIGLSAHDASGAFEYVHYRGATLVREIVHGCFDENLWEKLSGLPEPWEAWRRPPKLGKYDPIPAGEVAQRVYAHFSFNGVVATNPKAKPQLTTDWAKARKAKKS